MTTTEEAIFLVERFKRLRDKALDGLNAKQLKALAAWLRAEEAEYDHGCCVKQGNRDASDGAASAISSLAGEIEDRLVAAPSESP